jgi:hypothetical protein
MQEASQQQTAAEIMFTGKKKEIHLMVGLSHFPNPMCVVIVNAPIDLLGVFSISRREYSLLYCLLLTVIPLLCFWQLLLI